jgi:hypothetical protein
MLIEPVGWSLAGRVDNSGDFGTAFCIALSVALPSTRKLLISGQSDAARLRILPTEPHLPYERSQGLRINTVCMMLCPYRNRGGKESAKLWNQLAES